MSTWENLKESPTATRYTHHKPFSRLYPSLPGTSRLDVCLPLSCAVEKLHTKADPPLELPANPQSKEPVSTYERMKAEISLLKEQNKELFNINEKWSTEYRVMKQFYKEKTKEDKNAELQAQNRALTRKGRQQEEEIRRLNQVLKEALQSSRQLEGSSEAPQDLWKHQAEAYKEDFLKERDDREKLMGKYLKLEKRCEKIHRELNVLQSQVTLTPSAHCCFCTNRAKGSNWEDPHLDPDIVSTANSGSRHPSQSKCKHV